LYRGSYDQIKDLTMDTVQEQYTRLFRQLRRAQHDYHAGTPSMSNNRYNKLKASLQALEAAHPELVSDSRALPATTHQLTHLNRIRVPVVTSIESMRSIFQTWDAPEVNVSYGYRGLYCEAQFVDEERVALLALDSNYGTIEIRPDVLVEGIQPLTIPNDTPGQVSVTLHGWLTLRHEDFEAINAFRAQQGYRLHTRIVTAVSRLVTGRLRREGEPAPALQFIPDALSYHTPLESCDYLPLGGQSVPVEKVSTAWLEAQFQRASESPYEVACLVFRVPDAGRIKELGCRVVHSKRGDGLMSRWMFHTPLPPKRRTARVTDFFVQTRPGGRVNVYATIEPLVVSGTSIRRVSLRDSETAARLQVAVGDTILIERRADAEAQIVSVVHRAGVNAPWQYPTTCSCGGELTRFSDGPEVYCLNPECSEQLLARLCYFTSKEGFNIQGLGPSLLSRLVEQHLVTGYASLLSLTEAQLRQAGTGEQKAGQIEMQLQVMRQSRLYDVLRAIGMSNVRESDLDTVIAFYPTWRRLQQASRDDLLALPGISERAAIRLHAFVQSNPEWLSWFIQI
jgi:NAD-dependent DNA ligase